MPLLKAGYYTYKGVKFGVDTAVQTATDYNAVAHGGGTSGYEFLAGSGDSNARQVFRNTRSRNPQVSFMASVGTWLGSWWYTPEVREQRARHDAPGVSGGAH